MYHLSIILFIKIMMRKKKQFISCSWFHPASFFSFFFLYSLNTASFFQSRSSYRPLTSFPQVHCPDTVDTQSLPLTCRCSLHPSFPPSPSALFLTSSFPVAPLLSPSILHHPCLLIPKSSEGTSFLSSFWILLLCSREILCECAYAVVCVCPSCLVCLKTIVSFRP